MSNPTETAEDIIQRLQQQVQLLQTQNRVLLTQNRASRPAAARFVVHDPENPKKRPATWKQSDGVVKWNLGCTYEEYRQYFAQKTKKKKKEKEKQMKLEHSAG